jgi:IS5 family transposase
MRTTRKRQQRFAPGIEGHPHGRELVAMSEVLDAVPEVLEMVRVDLIGEVDPDKGRPGLTAEQVLRALVVKQMNRFSYEELAFHLEDSSAYRAFCCFGFADETPKKSALQKNIKRLKPETLEHVNRALIDCAKQEGIERGRKIRVDTTVTESNIHHPTDSTLLYDVVRVIARIVKGQKLPRGCGFRDHTRRAKRRSLGISNAKNKAARVPLYRDLLKVTRKTILAGREVADKLMGCMDPAAIAAGEQLRHYAELGAKVIAQTERRVLNGEKVPASEKIVSIFEPHTDIIVKDRRDTYYGHKLTLTSGASSLILDCTIEEGNPADSSLAVKMIERQSEIYDRAPRQACFDGGFASKTNLATIKDMGVKDVAFSKKCGLKITDMVKSSWVYKRLRNFRAGIEAGISYLKRCFGLDRCTWSSFQSFRSYVWGSIFSANLLTIARYRLR